MIKTMALLITGAITATVCVNAQTFTSGTFTSDSVLNLAGPSADELYGVSFGNSSAETTANGYTFGADPILGGPANVSDYGGVTDVNFLGGATTGDAAFNAVLNDADVPGPVPSSLTLDNLTIGLTYNVLYLDTDDRSGVSPNRMFSITDGSVTSPDQLYSDPGAASPIIDGGYILETFTATATSETIADNQPNGAQLNALLVEAVPEPSPIAMITTGVCGLFVLIRLRRNSFS
jgi:hypothetical protein